MSEAFNFFDIRGFRVPFGDDLRPGGLKERPGGWKGDLGDWIPSWEGAPTVLWWWTRRTHWATGWIREGAGAMRSM